MELGPPLPLRDNDGRRSAAACRRGPCPIRCGAADRSSSASPKETHGLEAEGGPASKEREKSAGKPRRKPPEAAKKAVRKTAKQSAEEIEQEVQNRDEAESKGSQEEPQGGTPKPLAAEPGPARGPREACPPSINLTNS